MNESEEEALRWSIVEACRNMRGLGLNQGTSGNISVRWGEGLLITPSGLPYDQMQAADIVFLKFDGTFVSDRPIVPSSEWRIHRDILLAKPSVNAVVHAHPVYSTAFAMCRREIPAVHYMIAAAGGPTIRCSDYATFGTQALSETALKALEDRTCCLLANHGIIATGPNLAKALWLAVELETLCQQYYVASQIGTPVILSDAEIALNIEKFKSYGLKPRPA
ncbi:class II aldolase/adducin family protein [Beijerinckia indica]